MSYYSMTQIGEGYENGHAANVTSRGSNNVRSQLSDSRCSGRATTMVRLNSHIQDQGLHLTEPVSDFLFATNLFSLKPTSY